MWGREGGKGAERRARSTAAEAGVYLVEHIPIRVVDIRLGHHRRVHHAHPRHLRIVPGEHWSPDNPMKLPGRLLGPSSCWW
jgi:hypothetical protein